MTAVELVIKEIDQQQKRYIDLAKKDKSIKKEVDAILTATTLLKMKCEQALEMEKQQIIDARVNGVAEGMYSEEDLKIAFTRGFNARHGMLNVTESREKFIEQFKNK